MAVETHLPGSAGSLVHRRPSDEPRDERESYAGCDPVPLQSFGCGNLNEKVESIAKAHPAAMTTSQTGRAYIRLRGKTVIEAAGQTVHLRAGDGSEGERDPPLRPVLRAWIVQWQEAGQSASLCRNGALLVSKCLVGAGYLAWTKL